VTPQSGINEPVRNQIQKSRTSHFKNYLCVFFSNFGIKRDQGERKRSAAWGARISHAGPADDFQLRGLGDRISNSKISPGAVVIPARVRNGRVEPEEPIPNEWEGKIVAVYPLTPDDALPDLEVQLEALHALGPIEYEPNERKAIATALQNLDVVSKSDLRRGNALTI
jgi:hypothetical protein